MTRLGLLLLSTIVVRMVRQGETIKCWSCQSNSPDEEGCSDPFFGSADVDSMYVRECETHNLQFLPNGTEQKHNLTPGLKFVCFKMTFTVLGIKDVMRGCASRLSNIPEGTCMDSEPAKTVGGNVKTCHVCAGDLCNDGNVIIKPNLGVVILLILSIVHNL